MRRFGHLGADHEEGLVEVVGRDQRQRVDEGVADGSFTCPDPDAAVARISALIDGLSVAALVYRTVTRAELRVWVAETVARELGIDQALLA